jgi:hypothetical protein
MKIDMSEIYKLLDMHLRYGCKQFGSESTQFFKANDELYQKMSLADENFVDGFFFAMNYFAHKNIE